MHSSTAGRAQPLLPPFGRPKRRFIGIYNTWEQSMDPGKRHDYFLLQKSPRKQSWDLVGLLRDGMGNKCGLTSDWASGN